VVQFVLTHTCVFLCSNVEQFPDDDNYRRVRISSEHFGSKVWDYPCCQDFLIRAGWMEVSLLAKTVNKYCIRDSFGGLYSFSGISCSDEQYDNDLVKP